MNKSYKHTYKEGVGFVPISEKGSSRSKGSRKNTVNSGSGDKHCSLFNDLNKQLNCFYSSILLKRTLSLSAVLILGCSTLSYASHDSASPGVNNNYTAGHLVTVKAPGAVQAVGVGVGVSVGAQATAMGNNVNASGLGSVGVGGDDIGSNEGLNLAGYLFDDTYTREGNRYFRYLTAIGMGSVALGSQSYSTGNLAIALGPRATATGHFSSALTSYSTATGEYSLAMGALSRSTAEKSMAIGFGSLSSGTDGIAIGNEAKASGLRSISIGSRDPSLVQVGSAWITTPTVAEAINSISIGSGSRVQAGANGGIAIGSRSHFSNGAEINGIENAGPIVYAINGIAIGTSAKAGGAVTDFRTIAIGNASSVFGTQSLGVGAGIIVGTGSQNSSAIGYSSSIGRQSFTGPSSSTFGAVDSGTAIGNHSQVMQGANYSTALGARAVVAPNVLNSVAIGGAASTPSPTTNDSVTRGAYVAANNSIALGVSSRVNSGAINSVAIGSSSVTSGAQSIAIGNNAVSSGSSAVAIGDGAKATAENTISIGKGNTVSGTNSGAIGDPNTVSGSGSYVLGNNNTITANNAFVIGNNATNNIDGSVALGSNSTTTTATPTASAVIAGIKYDFAGTAPTSVVSVGATGSERQIQNVAAGRVSASSTDAINGSQLFGTQTALGKLATSTATSLGGGTTVNADGSLNAPSYMIGSIAYNNVGDALAAASRGWNLAVTGTSGDNLVVNPGDTVVLDSSNSNLAITKPAGNNKITFSLNGALSSMSSVGFAGGTSLTNNGLDIANGPKILASGINAGNKKIINVQDGLISNTSTDAINGKQLYSVGSNIVSALGGGASLNPDGTIVSPSYVIKETANSTNPEANAARTVGTALTRHENRLSIVESDYTTLKNSPITFIDNENTRLAKKLGEEISIVGIGGNVSTKINGNNLEIKISDNPTFSGKVTANGFDVSGGKITNVADGTGAKDAINLSQLEKFKTEINAASDSHVTYDKNADGSLNKNKVTLAGSAGTVIANLADGRVDNDSKEAINGSQLYKAKNEITALGFGLKAEDNKEVKKSLGEVIDIIGDSANLNTVVADGKIKINLSTSPTFGTLQLNKDGSGKISGLTAGTIETDAVNLAQLKPLADALNAPIDATTGAVAQPTYNISGINHNTVGGALTALDGKLKQGIKLTANTDPAATTIPLGGTINISEGSNTDVVLSGGKYTIRIVDSPIFAGKVKANEGFDANNKNIINVLAGANDTDAVNLKQLKDMANAVANNSATRITLTSPMAYMTKKADGTNIPVARANDKKMYLYEDVQADGNPKAGAIPITTPVWVSAMNTDGSSTTAIKLSNIAPGTANTDAVNKSQLQSVVDALGGGAQITGDGAVTAPTYTLMGEHYKTVGDAFNALNHGLVGTVVYTDDKGERLVRVDGKFYKDRDVDPGGNLIGTPTAIDNNNVKLSAVDASHGVLNGGISLGNIKDGTLDKDAVNVSQLKKAGLNLDGTKPVVVYDSANANIVTLGKPDNIYNPTTHIGGVTITNLAEGKNPGDAVNFNQLTEVKKVADTASQGWNLKVNSETETAKITPGSSVTVKQGSNIEVVRNGADITIATVASPKFGSVIINDGGSGTITGLSNRSFDGINIVEGRGATEDQLKSAFNILSGNISTTTANSVNYNDTSRDKVSLKGSNYVPAVSSVTNGATNITTAASGGTTITNLANGIVDPGSSDAINGSQLYYTTKSIAERLGADVAPNGMITTPAYSVGGHNYNNITDAMAALNRQAGTVGYVNDTGERVRQANDGKFYKKLNHNGTGDTSTGDTGIEATAVHHALIGSDGATSGGKGSVLGNVAPGKIASGSTDAVNGGQLHTARHAVANILGAAIDADGNYVAPEYTIDGNIKTNVKDAITALNSLASKPITFTDDSSANNAISLGGSLKIAGDSKNISTEFTATKDTLVIKMKDSPEFGRVVINTANGGTITGLTNTTWKPDSITSGQAATEDQLKSAISNVGGNIIANKTRYFSVNSTVEGSGSNFDNDGAIGVSAIAIGVRTSASGVGALAMGLNAVATGKHSISLGQEAGKDQVATDSNVNIGFRAGSQANGQLNTFIGAQSAGESLIGSKNVAIGQISGREAVSNRATMIGTGAGRSSRGDDNTYIGVNAGLSSEGSNNIAIGNLAGAGSSISNTVLIGKESNATQSGDVAIGSNSSTSKVVPVTSMTINGKSYEFAGGSPANAFSVGSKGQERQIQHVAAGRIAQDSTDAINGSQLFATHEVIKNISGGVVGTIGNGKDGRDGKDSTDPTSAANTGPTSKDGLNGKDLTTKVNALRNGEAGTLVYTDNDGNRLLKGNDGSYYAVADLDDKGNPKSGATPKTPVRLSTVNMDGSTTTAVQLGNVAAGTKDTDAVNVKQLRDGGLINADGSAARLKFSGNDGAGETNFGTEWKIKGVASTAGSYSGNNIKTTVSSGNVEILLADAPIFTGTVTSPKFSTGDGGPSISKEGIDAGNKPIKNVGKPIDKNDAASKEYIDDKVKNLSDGFSGVVGTIGNGKDGRDGKDSTDPTSAANTGPTSKDGLNGKDLTTKVNALRNGEAGSMVYTDENGMRAAKGNDGKYYSADKLDSNGNPLAGANPIENVRISTVNPDGSITNPVIIGNVADGTIAKGSKDAVNGGQLFDLDSKIKNINNTVTTVNNTSNIIGGESSDDPKAFIKKDGTLSDEGKKALTTYNNANNGTTQHSNIISALNAINTEGTKFFHVNETGKSLSFKGNTNDSSAGDVGAVAVGIKANVSEGATNAIAIGTDSKATVADGVALGSNSVADRKESLAGFIPNGATADSKTAIEATTKGKLGSVSVGNDKATRQITNVAAGTQDSDAVNVAQLKAVASAAGDKWIAGNPTTYTAPKVTGKDSTAIGSGAVSSGNNSVSIGTGSNDGGRDNVVSVGSVGKERQISNVAPATRGTDAINLNQLNAGLGGLKSEIDKNKKEANAGTAAAMAIGNLPQSAIPGKGMLGFGMGYYEEEGAFTIGLSKMSDNSKWVFKSAVSIDTQDNVGAAVSLGYHW